MVMIWVMAGCVIRAVPAHQKAVMNLAGSAVVEEMDVEGALIAVDVMIP